MHALFQGGYYLMVHSAHRTGSGVKTSDRLGGDESELNKSKHDLWR